METPAHQEWRARQRVDWKAIWQTALFVGGILFVMSGGSPWTTAGTMNAAMGRDLPLGMFMILALHLMLAYVYVVIMAQVIYRLRLGGALAAGIGVGALLYVLNYAIFLGMPVQMQSPEFRAILVHLVFSLFASLVYKAASVPRPFPGDDQAVSNATRAWVPSSHRQGSDPEPYPLARRA